MAFSRRSAQGFDVTVKAGSRDVVSQSAILRRTHSMGQSTFDCPPLAQRGWFVTRWWRQQQISLENINLVFFSPHEIVIGRDSDKNSYRCVCVGDVAAYGTHEERRLAFVSIVCVGILFVTFAFN